MMADLALLAWPPQAPLSVEQSAEQPEQSTDLRAALSLHKHLWVRCDPSWSYASCAAASDNAALTCVPLTQASIAGLSTYYGPTSTCEVRRMRIPGLCAPCWVRCCGHLVCCSAFALRVRALLACALFVCVWCVRAHARMFACAFACVCACVCVCVCARARALIPTPPSREGTCEGYEVPCCCAT